MLQLLLTMMSAYDEYENQLNFTKSDIDNFIKKYNIVFDDKLGCNELGYIILWKNKYITNEQFAKHMDLKYENNVFWLICNDFDDILPSDYDYEISILDGTAEWYPSDYYKVNVFEYWDYYTTKTLERIINFCIDKELEIDGELITKENTKLIENDIFFNDKKLVEYFGEGELDDLENILNNAICEAQDSAGQSKIYSAIKKAFEYKIGEFKHVSVKLNDKNVEKLHIKLDIDWNEIKNFLIDSYDKYDFEEESYGNLYYILREMDFFKFRKPNYDYIYGSIDKELLNEYTQNRLDFD